MRYSWPSAWDPRFPFLFLLSPHFIFQDFTASLNFQFYCLVLASVIEDTGIELLLLSSLGHGLQWTMRQNPIYYYY